MKQQVTGLINQVRAHLHLLWTPRTGADTRQRAIAWLQKRRQRPPSHVPQERSVGPTGQPVGTAAGTGNGPRTGRLRRGPQPEDTLAQLLQTDARSQQYAEQLWWKFTQYYLPAKRLDIQARRGSAAGEQPGDTARTEA